MHKCDSFSTKKCSVKKYEFLFFQQNFRKSLYLVVKCNLTYLQAGNKKVKLMLRILEKIHAGSET
jgi:hypothetical protein